MRQWFHKSELAGYLEAQMSLTRTRIPSTPSITGLIPATTADDIHHLDKIATALHNLRLRLANYEELGAHVDNLTSYLQQMRRDFPLSSPDVAFGRLQPLRSLLFWLPPAILRPNESDLGAISLLSHLYALALVLEPLCPETSGACLGYMSIGPIESMHEMLQLRKTTMTHDNGLHVAISLMETPLQTAAAYRISKRQASQIQDAYRYSPQPSPFLTPYLQLASTPDIPPSSVFSNVSMQSARDGQVPGSSYFTAVPQAASPQEDSVVRSRGDRRVGMASPLSHLSYSSTDHTQQGSSLLAAELGYFGNAGYYPSQAHSAAHNRFVNTLPSVWT